MVAGRYGSKVNFAAFLIAEKGLLQKLVYNPTKAVNTRGYSNYRLNYVHRSGLLTFMIRPLFYEPQKKTCHISRILFLSFF
jgi:hypothetical protein